MSGDVPEHALESMYRSNPQVELRPDDVLQVVNTLVFDGMIDAVEEPSIDNVNT